MARACRSCCSYCSSLVAVAVAVCASLAGMAATVFGCKLGRMHSWRCTKEAVVVAVERALRLHC